MKNTEKTITGTFKGQVEARYHNVPASAKGRHSLAEYAVHKGHATSEDDYIKNNNVTDYVVVFGIEEAVDGKPVFKRNTVTVDGWLSFSSAGLRGDFSGKGFEDGDKVKGTFSCRGVLQSTPEITALTREI